MGGPAVNDFPSTGDDVFIVGPHKILANVSVVCRNLTILQTATLDIGTKNLNISGNTVVSGTLIHSNTRGTNLFAGDITVNTGGTWSNTTNEDITFKGNIQNNGSFIAGTGVYTFTGAAKNISGSMAIPNLTLNGSITNLGTLTVSTSLAGTGSLTNGSSATLNIGASAANLTLTTLVATSAGNTVNYNGTGQTIKGVDYTNLVLSGSGTKVLPNTTTRISSNFTLSGTAAATANAGLTIGGALTIGSGNLFSAGGYSHSIAGNFINSGTFSSSGTVVFNGLAAQSIQGTSATTFANLTLNNANGLSLINSVNTTVTGVLNLASGILATNASTLVLPATASVTRTTGYINGNLQKNVQTGSAISQTFETGTVSGYSPVTILFASVITAGNLTVKATSGDHPSIAASTLNPARSLNRFWTFANGGITTSASGYSATFTFVPADVDAGANTASLLVSRYASGTWTTTTVGTRTATSTQATFPGVNAFGDVAIGMPKPTVTSTALVSSANPSCSGLSLTLTATVSSGGAPVASEGTVTFKDGAITLGTSATINASGQGSITTSALGTGTHSITAIYNATANFAGSTSSALSQIINVTYQWIGGPAGDWETTSNWCGGVPGPSADVVIPSGTTVRITSAPATPAVCRNLLINPGAAVVINAGKALSVTGMLTNNATEGIVIKSDATGTGSLLDNGISGAGTARVERFLRKYNVINDGMYHFLSSPVSGQSISPAFSNPPGNFTDDFYKLDEPTYTWVSFRNPGNVINPSFETTLINGRGYLVAYNTDVTKTFTGTLNTGNLATGAALPAITYTVSQGSSAGWNLLGNPYPSAIDWDNVSASQFTNLDNAVYVYDNTSQTYKTYVGGIGSLTGGIIPAMQGFLVKAHGASASFRLENQDRVHSGQMYYKSTRQAENLLTLKVQGNSHADETSIRFMEGASADFNEQWDAYKLQGGPAAPNLYSKAGNANMAVKTLPLSALAGSVPVGLTAGVPGAYTLSAEGINSFTNATEITLEDKKTGAYQNLNNSPGYMFTVSAGDEPERFVLHFMDVTSKVEPETRNSFTVTQHSRELFINTQPGTDASITVSNILGQPLKFGRTFGKSLTLLDISALPEGLYVISLRGDTWVESRKIVLSR